MGNVIYSCSCGGGYILLPCVHTRGCRAFVVMGGVVPCFVCIRGGCCVRSLYFLVRNDKSVAREGDSSMKSVKHIVASGMTLTLAFGMTPTVALAEEGASAEVVGEAFGSGGARPDGTYGGFEDRVPSDASQESFATSDSIEAPSGYDKSDFYSEEQYSEEQYLEEQSSVSTLSSEEQSLVAALSATYATPTASSITLVSVSDEMKYFAKYESGANYSQVLSASDGYHAMGYYQFDNRSSLGDFLISCYYYNPSTYWMFEWVGYTDITGDLYDSGGLTYIGELLNECWSAAYAANPTEFSALQDSWAYQTYYLPAEQYLMSIGIDISERADCVKGLVWGMSNLFGTTGWKKFVGGVSDGYDWSGTYYSSYNYPGAWGGDYEAANAMSDREFVTTLCNYVIDNVAIFYAGQPAYHEGWQNRYRSELAECLSYIAGDEAQTGETPSNSTSGQEEDSGSSANGNVASDGSAQDGTTDTTDGDLSANTGVSASVSSVPEEVPTISVSNQQVSESEDGSSEADSGELTDEEEGTDGSQPASADLNSSSEENSSEENDSSGDTTDSDGTDETSDNADLSAGLSDESGTDSAQDTKADQEEEESGTLVETNDESTILLATLVSGVVLSFGTVVFSLHRILSASERRVSWVSLESRSW